MDPPQRQENGDGNHPLASPPSSSSSSSPDGPGRVEQEDEHRVVPREPPNGEAEEAEDDDDEDDDSGGSEAEDGGDDGAAAEDDDDNDDDDEEGDVEVNPLAHLPDYVLARVNKLRDLDAQRQELMDQYLVERAAVEKKYAGLFSPLYDQRAEVVRGAKDDSIAAAAAAAAAAEPKTAEPTSAVDKDAVEAARSAQEEPAAEVERRSTGIPHFWVTAMCNHETVSEWVTEPDVDCLEKLLNVTCVDHDDGKGFQLHFHFAENEYFDNAVLTKTYEVPNLLLSDEPLLKGVRGTAIQWKPGRSLTYRMVKKKQRGKGKHAGLVRTVQKREEMESFFKWFEPPEMPPMDSMDEEKAEELEAVFDEDYEMALVFRNQIIPRAVTWFTGDVRPSTVKH